MFDDSNFFHFAENAHLEPHSQGVDNTFENLICLCPTCHTKFDKNPDKKKSIDRLKDLKRHWFVASGNFSKLELDCLFSLYWKKNYPWLKEKEFTRQNTNAETKFISLSVSVPTKQGYLFQNLIENKLVHAVEGKGAFSGKSLTLGPNRPAEDTLWLILTDEGKVFCEKFKQSV